MTMLQRSERVLYDDAWFMVMQYSAVNGRRFEGLDQGMEGIWFSDHRQPRPGPKGSEEGGKAVLDLDGCLVYSE